MAKIRKIKPVKYFVAMLSLGEEGFSIAMNRISRKYGKFDIISDTIPFTFTDYYKKEMGENLLRKFASLENLMDPAFLPDFKIFTNQEEDRMSFRGERADHFLWEETPKNLPSSPKEMEENRHKSSISDERATCHTDPNLESSGISHTSCNGTSDFEKEMKDYPAEWDLHRFVNLDPGYLTEAKLILASTKDFSHRIYLRNGIFAEVTLFWKKGDFHPHSMTFPDYRTDFYRQFFIRLREKYREQLRTLPD